jgi:hypothetical protein
MKLFLQSLMLLLFITTACTNESPNKFLFQRVPPSLSHINFTNTVTNEEDFNILNYRNFYNGGGVGIGDLDNDGFPEIVLTSNMGDNKLYKNKGNFIFEDVTEKAGIKRKRAWSTGVTLVDINRDGLLDIYICNSGNKKNSDRSNECYINQGNLTFIEKAAELGLDDKGFSTHASFFDYDRDGDLDAYIVNNSFLPISKLNYRNLRNESDSLGGDKLLRNENGHFVDVTRAAKIYNSVIGFGLGVTVGDVNNDNWPDLYISNDFYEHDYLYINHHDGTFSENLKNAMGHTSLASMGADLADINNDASLDLFVTDMLPRDDRHLKLMMSYEGYDLYKFKLQQDYHHQITQNALQVNNGDGTFFELARFAGVEATDWSWGALIFDMDLDGLKDIFVANGIERDLTDLDFLKFLADETKQMEISSRGKSNFNKIVEMMPSRPVNNFFFRNEGGLHFSDKSVDWSENEKGFSNGAGYGDLDNDGDLDLVINNVNAVATILRSNAIENGSGNYLKVKLKGSTDNLFGIGARIAIYINNKVQCIEVMPSRGFQSSSDYPAIFGLGPVTSIDSVVIRWPDERVQVVRTPKANSTLVVSYTNAWAPRHSENGKKVQLFKDVTSDKAFTYNHRESNYVDYYDSPLLKQMYSTASPSLAIGDVNGDGLDDVVFGGAKGRGISLLLQNKSGKFFNKTIPAFEESKIAEITDIILFDADNDGDRDLFAVTGSSEFDVNDEGLLDYLYMNDGRGNFSRQKEFPDIRFSGCSAAAADFDLDGDLDLFVGSRLIQHEYGITPPSFLLVNNGRGGFKNYTSRYIKKSDLGMVTSAAWADLNNDRYPELVLVGDWMEVVVLWNLEGKHFRQEHIPNSEGWWSCLKIIDVDSDGDLDLVAGNNGLNSRIRVSTDHPAHLYVADFDNNGGVEHIITCVATDGKHYPMILKNDLEKQVPSIKKRFVKNEQYAGKTIEEIFTNDELRAAKIRKVVESRSSVFLQQSDHSFVIKPLPDPIQYSPINTIAVMDIDSDKKQDLVLAGNFFDVIPEIGRYDASSGWLALNKSEGNFDVIAFAQVGPSIDGQVRKLGIIKDNQGKSYLVVAPNDGVANLLQFNGH